VSSQTGAHNSPIEPGENIPHLARLIDAGVPGAALAFYGRWWQLENWLREVAYVELRSRYGVHWSEYLHASVGKRLAVEQRNAYMASADGEELLAYADVGALFALIEDSWDLFSPLLPPRERWRGRADELRELRNRNAHCRRPHTDDLARLQQALRDLERGAWLFYSSYLDTEFVNAARDPVGKAWIAERHQVAQRLLGNGHAARKYETRFTLLRTVRPWAETPIRSRITGTPGVLWYARWSIAGHELNVAELWRTVQRNGVSGKYLVHLLFDLGSVVATFAAVDDPKAIADAIGGVFDAILESIHPFRHTNAQEWAQRSFRGAESLPRQVQTRGPFTTVDPLNPPFLLFGA
jgi:hypothetical protein